VTGSQHEGTAPAAETNRLHESVAAAVIDAYYPEAVRSGSAARTRAQMAQSAVSLFAAGALATLTITALQDKPWPVKGLACLAIAAWLASAVGYTWAVGSPVPFDHETMRARTRSELVTIVLQRALEEKKFVDVRQRWAGVVAVIALVATALTVSAAVFTGKSVEREPAMITLTAAGQRAVSELCDRPLVRLEGQLQVVPEDPRTVNVLTAPGTCGKGPRELVVARTWVTALVIDGGAG
jgi:hypothetical protein